MPSRTRPIEKFAQAVAKCSTEVMQTLYLLGFRLKITGFGLRQMHCGRLQFGPQRQMSNRILEAEGLLPCMDDCIPI